MVRAKINKQETLVASLISYRHATIDINTKVYIYLGLHHNICNNCGCYPFDSVVHVRLDVENAR